MRRILALTLVVGLTLAACGGSGTEETTTTADDAATETTTAADESTTTAVPEATTTTVAESTTTVDEATTTTGGTATGSGGDDCLVGTWVLDSEAFVEAFSSIFSEQGMPEADVSALDGTFTVEMNSDGTYDAVRDGWGFAVATDEGTVMIEINGTESGTWATEGDILTINGDISDLTVNSSVEIDGQVVPMPENQMPVDTPPGIATDSTYTCSGDVLTLTNDGIESVMNRA